MNVTYDSCNDAAVRLNTPRRTHIPQTLLYLVAAVPLGAIGAAVLLAGWIVVTVLAITPLVVPALVGLRAAVGGLARLEGAIANALLGTHTAPAATSSGPPGFWRRASNVLGDNAFWKQQVFLLLRFAVGGTVAIALASLIAASLGFLTEPIWYRWGGQDFGSWEVDTLGRAFLFVPVGLLGLALAWVLIRPLAALFRSLAAGLLGGGGAAYDDPLSPAGRARRLRALEIHGAAVAVLSIVTVAIWAATTAGRYFWPVWMILPLVGTFAVHAWTVYVDFRVRRSSRPLALHAGLSLVFALFFVIIWAITGSGYFWPVWPILGLAVVFVVHLAIDRRFRRQAQRIEQLETTRAGALDQQDAHMRRIERDLHDGAQAQLVALGMSIGLAEQKLTSDPEEAQALLVEARRSAKDALEELRHLARGIHPPVLTDRGLEAAISTLADRTPLAVNVDVDMPERPPAAVETASYYVVAEALANTGKHAHAEHVDIAVRREGDALVVEVVDDGEGGADPAGGGLSGLRRRVEALDGTLTVTSPTGGPTKVRAVMPCAS